MKFTAKSLIRNAKKCEKNQAAQKTKLKKATTSEKLVIATKLRKMTTGCDLLIARMGLEERKRG
jgi:hypothetical protein